MAEAMKKAAAFPLMLALAAAAAEPVRNGFDLSGSLVPADEIRPGGPPRDGIPAIDDPQFESAAAAGWLDADDFVIGVFHGGEAKAYPIAILNWHEIVNDEVGGRPTLVTFCPLCGSGIVFAPPAGGRADFGVSGLLYNSDVLLYDRQGESLWSQILAQAISGPSAGARLAIVPSRHTSWKRWRQLHPHTLVLSRQTGHERDYDHDPYAGYESDRGLFFPVANRYRGPLHPKEMVLGVRIGEVAKAYPFSALAAAGQQRLVDTVGGATIAVHWDEAGPTAWVEGDGGVQGITAFWFAWYAFHPHTEVFGQQAPGK